jgi:hypothetical protein
LVTPEEMLADVGQLLAVPATEARRRTILSRCYYAAFHFMSARPETTGFSVRPGIGQGTHRQFIDYIKRHRDPKVARVGGILGALYFRRILADYQPERDVTNRLAVESMEDAKEIILDALNDD